MKTASLLSTIHTIIQKNNLIPPSSTVILGLSGGPDSLFLLHALAPLHQQGAINLIAAHLDHGWRPNSEKDAEFCLKTTETLGIPLRVAKLNELELSVKFNGSKEELGRKARRYFFEKLAHDEGAACIALAHHADDQQETFFLRLIRGATLTGLTGIKERQGLYIRPLLTIKKDAILAYLHANNIEYLVDESNTSTFFLRNRLRANVLPALRACDERFDKNFAATLARLQETEQLLEDITQKFLSNNTKKEDYTLLVCLHALRAQPRALQQRILMQWLCYEHVPFPPSQGFLDELLRFLNTSDAGNHQPHAAWIISKKNNYAQIKRID